MLDATSLTAVHAAARRNHHAQWKALDDALRRVCAEHPGHADRAGVNAKLYLIGRSFATGIERLIQSDGTQGGALRRLGDHIVANASSMDSEIPRLPSTQTPSDDELRTVVEVHGAVVALIKPVLHKGTPRSFVSKYLHFHSPAVPIYDAVAAGHLPEYVANADAGAWPGGKPAGDVEYRWYVLRIRALLRRLEALGAAPTVRTAEWVLAERPLVWTQSATTTR